MSWSEVAEPRPGRRSERPRRRSGDGQLLGLLLLGFGVVALLRESGVFQVKWEAILAGLLVTLGVGLVLTARTGRRIWPVALGVVLILALSANSPSLRINLPSSSALGKQVVHVQDADHLQDSYNQGVGAFTLDLARVAFAPGTRQVTINQGFGDLRILVPADVAVELNGNVGVGRATVLGQRLGDGVGVQAHYQTQGYGSAERRISLQVHVGFGQLEVARAGP
jgi:hypothetical protein